jgi:hypothetical protein
VALVSLGTYSLARARDQAIAHSLRFLTSFTAVLCALATLSAVGWGLYLISHKG